MNKYEYFGMVVLFVRDYERCFRFYTEAMGMDVLRRHEGDGHPPWSLLRLGDFRMALHAGHEGAPFQIDAICINFVVDDVPAALERIERFGGTVKRQPKESDFRPTQPVRAYLGRFADPDGNEHYLFQVTEILPE